MARMSEPVDPATAFDAPTEASMRAKPAGKWLRYDPDVLPVWVADMDFPPAETIRRALHAHLDHGSYGYPPFGGTPGLIDALTDRLATRFDWHVAHEAVHPLAGIIPGLFLGTLATTGPGEQVVVQPPIYPPFFAAIRQSQRAALENPLVDDGDRYVMDLDQLRSAITPATRALMFCNPHNPTGRVFARAELEGLAEVVLEHRLWVISDELHADLVFDGRHVPFASLSPEVAQRTITTYGPTKAFNLAGFKVGFLIAENPALLARGQGDRRLLATGGQHHGSGRGPGGLPRGRRVARGGARLPADQPRPPARALGGGSAPRCARTPPKARTWCGSTSGATASATTPPPRSSSVGAWA